LNKAQPSFRPRRQKSAEKRSQRGKDGIIGKGQIRTRATIPPAQDCGIPLGVIGLRRGKKVRLQRAEVPPRPSSPNDARPSARTKS
jgi:hypothetical protein